MDSDILNNKWRDMIHTSLINKHKDVDGNLNAVDMAEINKIEQDIEMSIHNIIIEKAFMWNDHDRSVGVDLSDLY